ncbi:uncharacterized protein [Paramisgurnus dabryanus]|uniref:uncharacterized protein n=1 Tax=Paramisgurnus dabryanus TaxID=90735 RepID=UPI0031F478EB
MINCLYLKMFLFNCLLLSVLLMIADGFTVKGSSGPLVVPLGGSVVLPCSVDSLLTLKDLEVEWRRSDSQTLIHLYQDEDIRPEAQHQDYHDRAHFFTEDIKHGNFSLLLNNLTAEDEGQYTCKVYSGQESGETVVEIKDVERLIVSGSSRSISASVGGDVTLSCSVDSHIKPEEIEEVSWKKTNKKEEITVLLYQYNETLPDASDERYGDRVEFFTDEIHRGNFSLRLKRVRTEDKGVYICQVFTGRLSANTTVILQQTGFSALHAMVLILCMAACGSAVILFCLIYCRSDKEEFVADHSDWRFHDLGDSMDLPCYVDPSLLPDSLRVEWRRSDSQTLVHLYEDGNIRPEAQHQDYHGRANFFTEDIKHGNLSLKLKDLREEDKGIYTCTVYSGQRSVFSISTKLVLVFYINEDFVALGDSVVLPCSIDKELIKKNLKVEWRRSDLETLVHLYEDGNIKPEAQHQDYHKRANFSKEKIKNGDFSLQLKKVRAEDKGEYTCKVYSEDDSTLSFNSILELGLDVDYTVVPLGGSVVLPCIDDSLLPLGDLKVEWRRSDSQTLIHLYEDEDIRPEAQHQDYHDRAHFFTEDIKHGNFSLLLNNLTAEDEGEYTCEVYSEEESLLSESTNLKLRLLHAVLRLQVFLVFCPNVIMFLAFVFWGVSEGSMNETIFCCALYILRPLMLLFAAPYLNQFTGKIETLMNWSFEMNYIFFTTVVYSVFFKTAWEKSLNYTASERVMILVLFVVVLLLCVLYIINVLAKMSGKLSERIETIFNVLAGIIIDVLPSLQFILLFYTFGSAKGGFFIVAILPVITTVTRYDWNDFCGADMGCSPLVMRLVWFILLLFMNAVLIYFYNIALENENDRVGWACMIGFLQVLWTVWNCLRSFEDWGYTRITAVYLFGSVGIVLISAVSLMIELILKTVNGEGLFGDLRIAVFSSESLFAASVLMLPLLAPWIKKDLQCCPNPIKCKKAGSVQNQCSQTAVASDETQATGSSQKEGESHEMKPLLNTQESDRNTERDKSQPDSIRSQP